ncbi:MAG: proline dehydrogenase family protein [Sphingobacteriaceae bacterium]
MLTNTSANETPLSFDNTEIAFKHKTNAELSRAYWLFKAINSNFLTKIGPPLVNVALTLRLPITGLIKKTIFAHFCGGETIAAAEGTVAQLAAGKVGTILDYSVEGEEEEAVFEETCTEIIRTIERAKGDKRIPLTVFKVTGVARFALLEHLTAKKKLDKTLHAEYDKVCERVKRICTRASELGVPVMIDAEETWIQDAIDDLALEMMRLFNRKEVLVYTTYQLYRNDRLAALKADTELAKKDKFMIGAKLVRGAYMEKERLRAQELGYPSPIHVDKAATDADYDAALAFCLANVDRVAFVAGTHNDYSCKLLTELLQAAKLDAQHKHVYFSQLLGMSDNLSFNLANAGYNVAKYVPYGPVKSVLPYLFRRAEENTSIAGQMGRELGLIIKERKRRKAN